jgi:hypothetical protein
MLRHDGLAPPCWAVDPPAVCVTSEKGRLSYDQNARQARRVPLATGGGRKVGDNFCDSARERDDGFCVYLLFFLATGARKCAFFF